MYQVKLLQEIRAAFSRAKYLFARGSRSKWSITFCLLLLFNNLSCAAFSGHNSNSEIAKTATPSNSPSPSQTNQPDSELAALINKWGNDQAEALTQRNPFHFFGDFDGDGNKDLAVLVQFKNKGASQKLAKNVTVLNPWLLSVEPQTKNLHETESDKALFVFHGTSKEWSADKPKGVFVLLDSVYDELKIINRDASDSTSKLPKAAKGDCFLTGTEDAKGIIYWNGKTYLWDQHGD